MTDGVGHVELTVNATSVFDRCSRTKKSNQLLHLVLGCVTHNLSDGCVVYYFVSQYFGVVFCVNTADLSRDGFTLKGGIRSIRSQLRDSFVFTLTSCRGRLVWMTLCIFYYRGTQTSSSMSPLMKTKGNSKFKCVLFLPYLFRLLRVETHTWSKRTSIQHLFLVMITTLLG